MIEIGRLCFKTTGKEAGKKVVIVDIVDNKFVLIDGNVKRRKCNREHLFLLHEKIDIAKGASTQEIKRIFETSGFLEEKKEAFKNKKQRKGGEKPKKTRPRQKKELSKAKGAKEKKAKSEDAIVEDALKAAEA